MAKLGSVPSLSAGNLTRTPEPWEKWEYEQAQIDKKKEEAVAAREGRRAAGNTKKGDSKFKALRDSAGNAMRDINGKLMFADNSCNPPEGRWDTSAEEKVPHEKAGFLKALEDMKSVVDNFAESCGFQTFKKGLKSARDIKAVVANKDDMKTRLLKAAAALAPLLPIKLSQACQNVIDNFLGKKASGKSGYIVDNGSTPLFVMTDEVDCAMDILEMVSGVPGLKGQIKGTIVDIEASAILISGMINSLADYEMLENVISVFGISENSWVAKKVIKYTENSIMYSGNTEAQLYVVRRGRDAFEMDPASLVEAVISSYKEKSPEDRDRLYEVLDGIDPNWAHNENSVYNFDSLNNMSKDAAKAFEEDDALRSLNMIASVRYIEDYNTKRKPTIAEVTRNLYPKACGLGLRSLPISDPEYLYA